MDWESMSAEQWEDLTEEQWEAMAEAEKEREAEQHREAIFEEEKADEALADAEIEDIEDAEPEPDIEEEMAPPPPPVEVWSLRAGQVFSVNIAAATFRLRAVAVNNAAAMESIFVQQQQAPAKPWVIPAFDNLTALSRVDRLLTLGIDAHLPILFANLYKVEYLEACRDWTWELQTAATAFGGTFSKCKSVKSICQGLRKVIAGALSVRRARTEEWLVVKLNSARDDLRALKVSTAFFKD